MVYPHSYGLELEKDQFYQIGQSFPFYSGVPTDCSRPLRDCVRDIREQVREPRHFQMFRSGVRELRSHRQVITILSDLCQPSLFRPEGHLNISSAAI